MGAREHVLKTRRFSTIASMLKHYRELPSRRKHSYIKAFVRRYFRIYDYIEVARIYIYGGSSMNKVNELLRLLDPALVIVDDSLYKLVVFPRKVRESMARRRHEEYLKRVADNLANYFRVLLEEEPRLFREELERFEK